MPHVMIVLIPYINLLNRSLIIKCLFLRNMEPLNVFFSETTGPVFTRFHMMSSLEGISTFHAMVLYH